MLDTNSGLLVTYPLPPRSANDNHWLAIAGRWLTSGMASIHQWPPLPKNGLPMVTSDPFLAISDPQFTNSGKLLAQVVRHH